MAPKRGAAWPNVPTLDEQGMPNVHTSPEEYRKFVLGETDRYDEVAKQSGAKQVD